MSDEQVPTIPPETLRTLAKITHPELKLERVVIVARGSSQPDDTSTYHATTWGREEVDKWQAARFGDLVREAFVRDGHTKNSGGSDFREGRSCPTCGSTR